MANEFVQTMSDARVDAQSLSEFVFKPAGFKVARRLAPTIDTLQFYIDIFNATKATTDAYIATIPNIINNAINNTAIEGSVLADTFVTATANGVGSVARTQRDKNKDFISVKDFGAVGDGKVDDTAAIQAAFDSERLGAVWFPRGLYKVTGTGEACLTLSKNRDIYGMGVASTIRADFAGAETSLLKISITDNEGSGDCRGWRMQGIRGFHNQGGKHGLHFEGGMSMVNAHVSSVSFAKGTNDLGYGLYCSNALSHSEVSNSEFDILMLKIWDANVFRKIITFGKGYGFTIDCENGVRNNTIADCTIVNRDGQVKILNGDNVRIYNNQMELAQAYTPVANQSNPATMIHIVGVDRPVINTIIEANNFGGGTSLDHAIYVDNAERTVIDKNQFLSTNAEDVVFTENSKFNIMGTKNRTRGNVVNRRDNSLFKATVKDLGKGNIGVLQPVTTLNMQSNWNGSAFYKSETGLISFTGEFSGGTLVGDSIIGKLPVGFRPSFSPDTTRRNLLTYTEDFSNSYWLKYGSSVIKNATKAPDDSITASVLMADAGLSKHNLSSAYVNIPNSSDASFSVYLKRFDAGSTGKVRVEIIDSSTAKYARATVDLAAGTATIGGNASFITDLVITVIAADNGFFRVRGSFKTTSTGGGDYILSVIPDATATSNTTYEGNPNVNKVYLWGVQLETSAASSPYQRVVSPEVFETAFRTKPFLATTDLGVGTVNISRQGKMTVGDLPSNSNVTIQPFQGAEIESV